MEQALRAFHEWGMFSRRFGDYTTAVNTPHGGWSGSISGAGETMERWQRSVLN